MNPDVPLPVAPFAGSITTNANRFPSGEYCKSEIPPQIQRSLRRQQFLFAVLRPSPASAPKTTSRHKPRPQRSQSSQCAETCHSDRSKPTPFLRVRFLATASACAVEEPLFARWVVHPRTVPRGLSPNPRAVRSVASTRLSPSNSRHNKPRNSMYAALARQSFVLFF